MRLLGVNLPWPIHLHTGLLLYLGSKSLLLHSMDPSKSDAADPLAGLLFLAIALCCTWFSQI